MMKPTTFQAAAIAGALLVLQGCATKELATPVNSTTSRPAAASTTGGFNWAWDITGDRAVRPIQVFGNDEKTWLQMAPQQAMPAIFVGGVPVPFDINPPYFVVSGSPARIDVIATNYRAVITKRNAVTNAIPEPNRARSADPSRIQSVPATAIPKEQP